ncbi:MAG: cell division protein FtsA [Salinivirgaceae bacterium]|nr:cell division protein FtsA [Salinivirgaceae bacterium]
MIQDKNIIAAVDIGTSKIVAMIGRKQENGKIEILGYGYEKSIGVKRGVVLNIEETVKSIKSAVQKAQQQSGIEMKDVYVGMAGQHIKSLRASGYITRESCENEISKEDLDKLDQSMLSIPVDVGQEIIHVLAKNYTVDREMGIKNPIGMAGKRLEANFHIVVGEIAAAGHLKKCIDKAGLNVMKIFLEPLASSAAVLTEDEKAVGVALVDIGGGTTDIAVYSEGIIQHTAVIPFGGQCVTEDIRKGLGIIEGQAEDVKLDYGYAIANDKFLQNKRVTVPGINGRPPRDFEFYHIAGIIQSRMEEIFEMVLFELEASEMKGNLGTGIVLTGGGAKLKNLAQLAAYVTGCDIRIGSPRISVIYDKIPEIASPVYATSVGLLLCGYEDQKIRYATQKINNQAIVENDEEKKDIDDDSNSKTISPKRTLSSLFNRISSIKDLFDVNDYEMNQNAD